MATKKKSTPCTPSRANYSVRLEIATQIASGFMASRAGPLSSPELDVYSRDAFKMADALIAAESASGGN